MRAGCLLLLMLLAESALSAEDKCSVCGHLVEDFHKGLERTAKDNFGGGNTHWEESRLGSYAFSETRLVDITERLCQDKGKEESVACHSVLENAEEFIESWWANGFKANQSSSSQLRQLLCVQELRLCCPLGSFGPACGACAACAAEGGDCEGNGTRGGSGACVCRSGYEGDDCGACKAGFQRRDSACEDVDECERPDACGENQQCNNSPGSFTCSCVQGFVWRDAACLPLNEEDKVEKEGEAADANEKEGEAADANEKEGEAADANEKEGEAADANEKEGEAAKEDDEAAKEVAKEAVKESEGEEQAVSTGGKDEL